MTIKTTKQKQASNTLQGFLTFFILTVLLLGTSWKVQAVNYYGKNGQAPNLVASWGTVSGGSGTAPSNFTTAVDNFIIETTNNTNADSFTSFVVNDVGENLQKVERNNKNVVVDNKVKPPPAAPTATQADPE